MPVIILPLHIEVFGSGAAFNEAAFRANILPLINQIWDQAQIRFQVPHVHRLSTADAGHALDGRPFHVNRTENDIEEYDTVQLQGIARTQPRTGFRICITGDWSRTQTIGGLQRPANLGNAEGTLAAALGAGNLGIAGLERTIVVRPPAVTAFLLAHELGHLLIGPGHQERGNLMAASSEVVYNRLTESQINLAQATARHVPGHHAVVPRPGS